MNKDEQDREFEKEDRLRSERAERLGIESESGDTDTGEGKCARCGEPAMLGGNLCDYCQQIWDHID